MPAIADTSFVVGLANQSERWHEACKQLKKQETFMILPQSVLAEVGYIFTREFGNRGMSRFLYSLPESKYRLEALTVQDLHRTAELPDKYADTRVDFVDATIVAVAERLQVARILTLDHRDFSLIRPAHIEHFELLPQIGGSNT